ncbi:MAG: bis(5'-nucleosyl)-tetraphosphatase (symmetrical) YqeK [Acetatifactor sp.]|nr:bis(5'-nucleosyl)-tetraphosphatase (symmetrical) YqeK [Acetatifactor sp.]
MQNKKDLDIGKIRKSLKKTMDSKRYEHTLGVEYTAAALAMCHGGSITEAQLAGLLHDCAKCITNEKKISLCEKYKIEISEVERRNPFLLHSKLGAFLAEKKYHVQNQDIINAIRNHTTGRPEMSLLEKIVFIADYIEPGRKQAPNLETIRKIAFEDIDSALVLILKDTLTYLKNGQGELDPMTEQTYQYYIK